MFGSVYLQNDATGRRHLAMVRLDNSLSSTLQLHFFFLAQHANRRKSKEDETTKTIASVKARLDILPGSQKRLSRSLGNELVQGLCALRRSFPWFRLRVHLGSCEQGRYRGSNAWEGGPGYGMLCDSEGGVQRKQLHCRSPWSVKHTACVYNRGLWSEILDSLWCHKMQSYSCLTASSRAAEIGQSTRQKLRYARSCQKRPIKGLVNLALE